MCGSVWYIVAITEGGRLIITITTILTTYNITGLNDNTLYQVNVTASNNAGNSSSAVSIRTITNGKSVRGVCA